MKIIEKTIHELSDLSKNANSSELAQINAIKKALESKDPDQVLIDLKKTGALKDQYSYWLSQSSQRPDKIKNDLSDQSRPVIEILIDLHILRAIGGKSKKIFENLDNGLIATPGSQSDLIRFLENEYGRSCTRAAISNLVKAKDYRFQYSPRGKILIEPTAKALVDSGFPKMQANKKKKESANYPEKSESSQPVNGEENLPTQEEVDESPLKETDDYNKINKYLAFQKYEKERIANEKSKKELTNFNETADAVFNFLRPFRDDVIDIGKRISAIAYQSKSKHEAQKVIDEEVDRIFKSRVGDDYKFDDDLKKKIIQILLMSLQRQ